MQRVARDDNGAPAKRKHVLDREREGGTCGEDLVEVAERMVPNYRVGEVAHLACGRSGLALLEARIIDGVEQKNLAS